MEHFFACPYCWKEISIIIDVSEQYQQYIEDCEVCCNPINIRFELVEGIISTFEAEKT